MNKKLLSFILGFTILLGACKKDNTVENNEGKNITDIVVPADFQWQTSRDVNFSIGISDSRFQNLLHVIAIYLTDPSKGGTPVAKGSASLITPFNAKLSVPSTIKEVYVIKTAPDGSSVTEKLSLISNKVSTSISSVSSAINRKVGVVNVTADAEPECINSTTNTNIDVPSSSSVVCFTASSDVTVNVTANSGGTLKLSAPGKTITVGTFNHSKLKVYVSTGTTVKINSDLNLSSSEEFTNNGTINGSGFINGGRFVNNGAATFTGNFNLNGNSTTINNGTFTAPSSNLNSDLTNNGTFTFSALTINGQGLLNNYCKLNVTGNLVVNKILNNYKLVVVGNETEVNGNGEINLYDGAMFQTNNLTKLNGTVNGQGATSLFKVVTNVGDDVLNNNGYFKGALQYCGTKDIEVNQNNKKHFSDGATKGCGVYIAKDGCNTIGNGTAPAPVKPDTDNDGVIDEQDAYPSDPTKAFNNYSLNYNGGGSTVAFEDSWPLKGDYDLNDVVLSYRYLVVTNAANNVVRLQAEWNLLATGGNFRNGAGIQFNLLANSAKNFNASNGLSPEAGQDSLVVILFTDSRAEQANWNTKPGVTVSPSKTYTFSFDLENGPSLQTFGISSYNPFVWNNTTGFGRSYEAHLYGKNPTKLAKNSNLFGTGDDNSINGKFYGTDKKLPWAIELPIAPFQYPAEQNSIADTYLKFSDWAMSGGTTDQDWYSNTASGYRNNAKIFSAN
ncbi:LruC domain-containing protein [Pedobacter frigoris]|uniref:LruC domain-containing protein n=1 Tax=Pedobacter frigoris TaxID=2571272 RepID=A0A4V5P1A6_9SPHI|nr:LruC domain-containing protein [Pedobacter frigoris]TKC09332.1 LruC domain-containing protein [Pedobacter frigoris]